MARVREWIRVLTCELWHDVSRPRRQRLEAELTILSLRRWCRVKGYEKLLRFQGILRALNRKTMANNPTILFTEIGDSLKREELQVGLTRVPPGDPYPSLIAPHQYRRQGLHPPF